MKCPECGREFTTKKQFCPYCGAKIARSVPQPPVKKSLNKWIIIGVAVSLMIVAGIYFTFNSHSDNTEKREGAFHEVVNQYKKMREKYDSLESATAQILKDYPLVGDSVDIIYDDEEITSLYYTYDDIDQNGNNELVMGYKKASDNKTQILAIYLYQEGKAENIVTVSNNGGLHITSNHEIIEEVDVSETTGTINVITVKDDKTSSATYSKESGIGLKNLTYEEIKKTFKNNLSWTLIKEGVSSSRRSDEEPKEFEARYMPQEGEYFNVAQTDKPYRCSVVIKKVNGSSFDFTIYQHTDEEGQDIDPSVELLTTHTATFKYKYSRSAYYYGDRYTIKWRCGYKNSIYLTGFTQATRQGHLFSLEETED